MTTGKAHSGHIVQVALVNQRFAGVFDYIVPSEYQHKNLVGTRVIVPFGNKRVGGFVVGDAKTRVATHKLRALVYVCFDQTQLHADDLALRSWVAHYYLANLATIVFHALPKRLRTVTDVAYTAPELLHTTVNYRLNEDAISTSEHTHTAKQRTLYDALKHQPHPLTAHHLKQCGISVTTLRSAEKKGMIVRQQSALPLVGTLSPEALPLNESQATVSQRICQNISGYEAHLLYGVTGSGKTHVMIEVIRQYTQVKKQRPVVLVLVPEIALAEWMSVMLSRYLSLPVTSYHSKRSDTHKATLWLRLKQAEPLLVVGTRSACLLPLEQVGLLLIDEEHDQSYKDSGSNCMYHARDLLVQYAYMAQLPVVLASATPSLASLENAKSGKYQLHRLTQRATGVPLPHIRVLDETHLAKKDILHPLAQKAIVRQLNAGNSILVFINRRGFAPVTYCTECSWRAHCPDCETHLVWHADSQVLLCHRCGHKEQQKILCPVCQTESIKQAGIGTQQVEDYVRSLFEYPVVRLDQDNKTHTQLQASLAQLDAQQPTIIVATQLFIKGFSVPNLQLTVVLDIDSALYSADLFATEHCMQNVLQVAGRSGRQQNQGEVYLQTRLPNATLWRNLNLHDYDVVMQDVRTIRQRMNAPPFCKMIAVYALSMHSPIAQDALMQLMSVLKQVAGVTLTQPTPAIFTKRQGKFYWQLTLWGNGVAINRIKQLARNWQSPTKVRMLWDVDPVSFYD